MSAKSTSLETSNESKICFETIKLSKWKHNLPLWHLPSSLHCWRKRAPIRIDSSTCHLKTGGSLSSFSAYHSESCSTKMAAESRCHDWAQSPVQLASQTSNRKKIIVAHKALNPQLDITWSLYYSAVFTATSTYQGINILYKYENSANFLRMLW